MVVPITHELIIKFIVGWLLIFIMISLFIVMAIKSKFFLLESLTVGEFSVMQSVYT